MKIETLEVTVRFAHAHKITNTKEGKRCDFVSLDGKTSDGRFVDITMGPILWDGIASVVGPSDTLKVTGEVRFPERGEPGYKETSDGKLVGRVDDPTPTAHVKSVLPMGTLPKYADLPDWSPKTAMAGLPKIGG